MSKKGKSTQTGKVQFLELNTQGDAIPADLERDKLLKNEPSFELNPNSISQIVESMEPFSSVEPESSGDGEQKEVLQKYIELKDAEVRDLKEQIQYYQKSLQTEKKDKEELHSTYLRLKSEVASLKGDEARWRKENQKIWDIHESELGRQKKEYENQLKGSRKFEAQLGDLSGEREAWKQKVQEDLRRIRLKEKEIENKYALLKQDTQTLLDAKDKRIMELSTQVDNQQMDLESLEERLRSERRILDSISSKKSRLIETMRLAIHLLEQIDRNDGEKPIEKVESSAQAKGLPGASSESEKPEGAEVIQDVSKSVELSSDLEKYASEEQQSQFNGGGFSEDLNEDLGSDFSPDFGSDGEDD